MAIKMVNIKKKYSFERMMNSDVINMVSKFGIQNYCFIKKIVVE